MQNQYAKRKHQIKQANSNFAGTQEIEDPMISTRKGSILEKERRTTWKLSIFLVSKVKLMAAVSSEMAYQVSMFFYLLELEFRVTRFPQPSPAKTSDPSCFSRFVLELLLVHGRDVQEYTTTNSQIKHIKAGNLQLLQECVLI